MTTQSTQYLQKHKLKPKIRPVNKNVNLGEMFMTFHKTKDKNLRTKLALANQSLVHYIVNRYYSTKPLHKKMREDLVQEGHVGLMSAIDGFDPTKGFRFSTFAVWWVKQAINNYVLNVEPIINVPSHVKTAQNRILEHAMAAAEDPHEFLKKATVETKTEGPPTKLKKRKYGYTNKMLKSIASSLTANAVCSLGDEVPGQKNTQDPLTIGESLVEDSSKSSDQVFDNKLLVQATRQAFQKLSVKDRLILLFRFNIISEQEVAKLRVKWNKTAIPKKVLKGE